MTGIADALHPCSPDAVRLAGTAEASDAAWEAKREALKNKERPLILNSDGNDMIFYPTNAPITVAAFREQRLNSYRNTRISTLSYCPQSSPFGCMTARKAGWLFDSPTGGRGCLNATSAFIEKLGTDCLEMASDFCRENGMEIFVSIRVNDTHDSWVKWDTKHPQHLVKFKAENPDCLMGTAQKHPPYGAWTAVDFENPKVRDAMKKFVSDFVNNYDVDGIEYDFMRHGPIFKSVGWGAYATKAQLKLMTDFMVELRSITEAAGRKKGKPILVLVRTADSLGYAKGIGIDVEAWLKAGVMDIWSVSDYFQLDYLKPNADLAHRYGVKFYSALAESRVKGSLARLQKKGVDVRMLPGRNTIASFAAEYAAAQAAGCDGIESFNLSTIWRDVNAPELLKIDPRDTKGLDKVYFALVRGSGGYSPETWLKDGGRFYRRPRIDPGWRPFELQTGKPFAFKMEIGDDPKAGGRATVKALFTSEKPVIEKLTLNGRGLSLASFENGIHTFELGSSGWVRGENEFKLTPSTAAESKVVFCDFAVYINYSNNKKGKTK